mgnify:CR=1 FL=1
MDPIVQTLVGDLLWVRLNEEPDKRLQRRLYNAIRRTILDGSLLPGSRMPGSRDLAQQLGLSRNTVLTVYEQLLAEGYIVARRGSGTFVADTAPDSFLSCQSEQDDEGEGATPSSLSRRGEQLLNRASASPRQWGAFIPGVPDVSAFPHRLFSKIQARLGRRPPPERLTYSCQGGTPELRNALVDYLRVARSVRCHADQILITEGTHQAIDLVARMLCDAGDHAWIEEPSYWGIRNVLKINEINMHPIPVDHHGMIAPEQVNKAPRLIFVTPSHQYPLGAVMSLERRRHLLALARHTGAWIVEDDYDSEFRFSGQPIPALQGLVADAPVIYMGTFSKTLYPGLRIGYVVLPRPLAERMKTAHAELYRSGHSIIQAALAEFIQAGHYTAHIRRMRLLYGRRRAFVRALIEHELGPDAVSDFSDNAGLHMILNLPSGSDDVAIAQLANQRNILVRPLSRYYLTDRRRSGLIMGFASQQEEQMAAAFQALLTCIREA